MGSHTLHITLPGDGTDFAYWRTLARELLLRKMPPQLLEWSTEQAQAVTPDLFVGEMDVPQAANDRSLWPVLPPVPAFMQDAKLTVPRWWMPLAEQCLLHASPDRFALLYRMLARMQDEPGLRHDPLDADHVRIQHMVKAVRREVHKMHAFVRFRPIEMADDAVDGSGPLHVAWFEPEHFITQAAAPFFVKRFANMRWAILTPQCCLRWWPEAPSIEALQAQGVVPEQAIKPLKGRAGVLSWSAGAKASDAPAPDAGENLWLTYYAHTFNPARLKLKAMYKEMPRRYWHNLPEAQLISPLVQAANARSAEMLARAPTTPQKRLPKAAKPVADEVVTPQAGDPCAPLTPAK